MLMSACVFHVDMCWIARSIDRSIDRMYIHPSIHTIQSKTARQPAEDTASQSADDLHCGIGVVLAQRHSRAGKILLPARAARLLSKSYYTC